LENACKRPSWQWLIAATAAGFVSGLIWALLGVFASQAIHDHLAQDQQTELGDAVLAIYAFLTFAATRVRCGILERLWHFAEKLIFVGRHHVRHSGH
jgi:membrane protein DedA with SNARE-associated domain